MLVKSVLDIWRLNLTTPCGFENALIWLVISESILRLLKVKG